VKLVLVQPEFVRANDASAQPLRNLDALSRQLEPRAEQLTCEDVVLLPEHIVDPLPHAQYATAVCDLARRLGCHVVGGSHHDERGEVRVNAGIVSDSRGQVVAEYEKLRPYAGERSRVAGGSTLGELSIAGRRILVLVCADFWFSDVFQRVQELPDLVLVPAYSVSRKPHPNYSRELWRHLAIARAYEFGVYVGVSDWAHVPVPGLLQPSAVAGLADPTTTDVDAFFASLGDDSVRCFTLDFDKLAAFRADRLARGFFWKTPHTAGR
jgi:predicted amidohydrolase